MTPNEERVLKIALDAYDDDLAEVAVTVLQDELLEQWDRSRRDFVGVQRILRAVPWSMPMQFQWTTVGRDAEERPPPEMVYQKRRWLAKTMAAYLLFRDWPRTWPLARQTRP